MKKLVAFLVGFIFALGLGLSGMTQVQVVKGFLDVFGEWNPALMGVMIGAIGVHGVAFYFIRRRGSPLLDTKFSLPTRNDIDARLISGAAIFGIGWGWTGICPGPSIVGLASGELSFVVFVIAMLAGMVLHKMIEPKL